MKLSSTTPEKKQGKTKLTHRIECQSCHGKAMIRYGIAWHVTYYVTVKHDIESHGMLWLRMHNGMFLAGMELSLLYNNQINARALIGQSAKVYCANNHRNLWLIA